MASFGKKSGSGKASRPITAEGAKLRMAGICSKSEQCGFDIRMKLMKLGLSGEDIREIMEFLYRERFLDDARFCRAYASDKVRFSGWGPLKVRAGLFAKRMPEPLISEAIERVGEEVVAEVLLKLVKSASRRINLQSREEVMKLYRRLAARGFSASMINRAVSQVRTSTENEK